MIRFLCTRCSKPLRADESKAGVSTRCPGCGQTLIIPDAPEEVLLVAEEVPDEPKPSRSTPTRRPAKGEERSEQPKSIHPSRLSFWTRLFLSPIVLGSIFGAWIWLASAEFEFYMIIFHSVIGLVIDTLVTPIKYAWDHHLATNNFFKWFYVILTNCVGIFYHILLHDSLVKCASF